MRLYGNLNRTDADSWDINLRRDQKCRRTGGVTNKDINSVFSWKMTPQQILDFEAGYSRQGIFMLAIRKTVLQTRLPKVWRSPGGRPIACTGRITV